VAHLVNWRSPLWLSVLGLVIACVLVLLAGRRHSFTVELVDEYTGAAGGDEEPGAETVE